MKPSEGADNANLHSTVSAQWTIRSNTVEPPNKGHFGANSFVACRDVVPISEVK